MNQQDPSESGEPIAKRTRSNTKRRETAAILKLDIDCFEELFEYLPLEDLVRIGKTCKRLQRVAGYFYQQNYFGIAHILYAMAYPDLRCYTTIDNLNHFVPFIRDIYISSNKLEHGLDILQDFQQLTQIHLSKPDWDRLKKMSTTNAETLYLNRCDFNIPEFIDRFPKLRRLYVKDCDFENKSLGRFCWLIRKYPTLEYLALDYFYDEGIELTIAPILILNPNIRMFHTKANILTKVGDLILSTNIKLDILSLRIHWIHLRADESIFDLLHQLYKRGFYKKLHLEGVDSQYPPFYQNMLKQLAILQGLVKMSGFAVRRSFTIFKNLEDLHIEYIKEIKSIVDCEILAKELINLKRLYFFEVSFDAITEFIRRSVKVHSIKMEYITAGTHFNKDTQVIDILTLNRERKKLPNAHKITLYVEKEIYVATKWAFAEIDVGMIRLKQLNSKRHAGPYLI